MKLFPTLLVLVSLFSPAIWAAKPKPTPSISVEENPTQKLMKFSGNIHQFNSIFPQEKVYLEFDNTAYFQGDIVWFKAFVRHATSFKRAQSGVLYVDLISPTGHLIEQQKLKIVDGQADGAFVLVDIGTAQSREKRGAIEYPSGFYEIRAYTQNILNFSYESVFSRVIPVYRKVKHPEDFAKSHVVIQDENQFVQNEREESNERERKINLSFYPEGGDLISGLPCNVAFKATGADGFALEGAIVYRDGADTAYTVHDGMGSFTVIPNGSQTVRFITDDGKSRRFSLPKSVRSGYSMIAQSVSDTLCTVQLRHTSDLSAQHIGMAVTCRGDLVDFLEINDCPADTTLNIDCSGWPLGVCRMTFYDQNGRILTSRSLFHNNSRFCSPTITLFTDSLSRVPFSKEVLSLQLTDKDGNPIHNRFCLSVRDADDYGTGLSDNLQTNLLLSSDLKGYIHDPAWYLAQNDDEHRTALNLLTLVQGWERYEWKTMTGQEYFSEEHRIEDSLTMNGWVLSYAKREPVKDIDVYASVMPLKDKASFETFKYNTDSTGYFGFNLSDFYGKARMNIHLMSKKRNGKSKYEKTTRIKLERSDRPHSKSFSKQEIDLSRNRSKKQEYEPDFTDAALSPEIRKKLGILLDDVDIDENAEKRQFVDYDTYTTWNTEEETELELDLGEYTTDFLGYLLEKGIVFTDDDIYKPYFYIHNQERVLDKKPFDDPWGIDMIDVKSVIIFDEPMRPNKIIEFTPLLNNYHKSRSNYNWFDWVDTCNKKFYLIDIQIKSEKELLSYDNIRNLSNRTTTIEGFSQPVEFYGPQYPEGPIEGDADLRRTLYWNPNVITNADGRARVEFYNNSYSQHYTISGAGITASGIPYILQQDW